MARPSDALVAHVAPSMHDQPPADMALDPMLSPLSEIPEQAVAAGLVLEKALLSKKSAHFKYRESRSQPLNGLNLAFPEPLKRRASTREGAPVQEASTGVAPTSLPESAAIWNSEDTRMTRLDAVQQEDYPVHTLANEQAADRALQGHKDETDSDELSEMDDEELEELERHWWVKEIAGKPAHESIPVADAYPAVQSASTPADARSNLSDSVANEPRGVDCNDHGADAIPRQTPTEASVAEVARPTRKSGRARQRASTRELKGLHDFLALPTTRPEEAEEPLYDEKGRPLRKRRAPASRNYADFVTNLSDRALEAPVEDAPVKKEAPSLSRPRKRLKTLSNTPRTKRGARAKATLQAESAQVAEPRTGMIDGGMWAAMLAHPMRHPIQAVRRKSTTPIKEPVTPSPKSALKSATKIIEKSASKPILPPSPPATPSDDIVPPPRKPGQSEILPPSSTKETTSNLRNSSSSMAGPEPSTNMEEVGRFDIDENLLRLSRSLTRREPLEQKPAAIGEPEVWADSRQALCETVPYFKKPQGGCHQNDRHVYSFLYDGSAHCREYSDPEVIIARAGGGMESDTASGGMLQGKNQSMFESQVQAVLNDMQLENPLIVIRGDRNANAVCKMPHKYCVLGWYKPTMVWAEKTAGKGGKSWVTIKYRFEWLKEQSNAADGPWHAPKEPPAFEKSHAGELLFRSCDTCEQRHPQIYLQTWLCLTPTCAAFWKLEDGREAPAGTLDYNPAFLLHRTPWACEEEPYSVRPPLPTVGQAIGDNLTYENTRGVVCPKCGRCNQRYKWEGWHCANPACDWDGLRPQHRVIVPKALHTPWDMLGDGPALARNKHAAGINVSVRHIAGYKVTTYTFDGVEGRFVHAAANKKVNGVKWGADEMFADIQTADMGLERRRFGGGEKMVTGKNEELAVTSVHERSPATPERPSTASLLTPPAEINADSQPPLDISIMEKPIDIQPSDMAPLLPAKVEDGDFMTAFSMNYGMPYKFVASGSSKPFEEAPWPVQACRTRLNKAAKAFLGEQDGVHDDFNEELIFAYMERQKIEYHDDGEEGLGPRIATLSLGGKAQMHMRMKAKHYAGCSKTGILTADRPVKGCFVYEERLAVWKDLQQLRETDRAAYYRRIKEVPKELGLFERRNKKPDDLVTVTLSHGDIVLMDGYDIQKYLEHKVVPEGYLRFALTCRNVLENHLKDHEKPTYAVKPDEALYDGWDI